MSLSDAKFRSFFSSLSSVDIKAFINEDTNKKSKQPLVLNAELTEIQETYRCLCHSYPEVTPEQVERLSQYVIKTCEQQLLPVQPHTPISITLNDKFVKTLLHECQKAREDDKQVWCILQVYSI